MITIHIDSKVYLKYPESSELGKKIVQGSIELMDELGFENFTFKKLAILINSTEASIYRYFESKHHILIYLVHWYWAWQEYRIELATKNIVDPNVRLHNALRILTEKVIEDSNFSQINEVKLNRIVIAESAKIYLSKNVETDNRSGYFSQYKTLVHNISEIIMEINPKYKYPHMLISTVIEGALHQRYFSEHLPKLTDIIPNEDAITNFYLNLVKKEIE